MITTIYELLGMIKDGKAPKKIIFKEDIYEYRCSDCIDYYCDKDSGWLFDDYDITDILNDEVTILETTINWENVAYKMSNDLLNKQCEEFKKEIKQDTIKKVDEPYESVIFKTDYEFATELEKKIIDNIELIRKKQDEIIDKMENKL